MKELSSEYLLQCLSYRKDGSLLWKKRPKEHFPTERGWRIFNSRYANQVAGCQRKDGRWQLYIDCQPYLRSVIVWTMLKGFWPNITIDHKDTDPGNDRISNLREASYSEQQCNTNCRIDNQLSLKNIYEFWDKEKRYFQVEVRFRGRRKRRRFADLSDAVIYRDNLVQEMHGAFARSA